MEYSQEELKSIKKILPYILATAIFMQMLDATVLNTALPAIGVDLKVSPLNMQSAIISYVITLALFMPISGYFADKFGTKRIFIFSLFLFALGSLLCAVSYSLSFLVFSRVIQGLGGALMTPIARLALMRTYDKNELVVAMNYAIIPALIAPVIGPLVGGYLVDYLSWHWIFLINIPIAAFGILMSIKYMPSFSEDKQNLDFKGFLIFGASSVLLSVGLELVTQEGYEALGLIFLLIGFVLLPVYHLHAKRKANALFPISLLKVRTFRVGILGNLACRLGISSLPLLIPLFMQVDYRESAMVSGWIVAPMALSSMIAKPFAVPILNKLGYRKVLLFNTIFIGILIMLFAIPSRAANVYLFIPIVVVVGFFNSVQFTAMNSITIADLRPYQTSSGNGLLSVNQQLALGFGIAIGLALLKFFQSQTWFDTDTMHWAFRLTFISIGFVTILSTVIFAKLHPNDGDNLKTIKVK